MARPTSIEARIRRHGRGSAALVLAGLLLLPAWLAAAPAARAETCTWGQPGYRDCVEDLIAKAKSSEPKAADKALDPQKALQDSSRKTAPQQASKGRKSGRRPGAGSLTPVPPVPFEVTPPRYDAAGQAIAAERRQRQVDDNLFRLQRQTPVQPILPPVVNPPSPGQICPSWGC